MFPNALHLNWCNKKLCYEQAVVQVSMIGLGSLLTVFFRYHSILYQILPEIQVPPSLDETPLTIVETIEDLVKLNEHLKTVDEFAVDLEVRKSFLLF